MEENPHVGISPEGKSLRSKFHTWPNTPMGKAHMWGFAPRGKHHGEIPTWGTNRVGRPPPVKSVLGSVLTLAVRAKFRRREKNARPRVRRGRKNCRAISAI